MEKLVAIDKGGRRLGIDRRQLSIPPKGVDRRSKNERRSGPERRTTWTFPKDSPEERRSSFQMDFYGLIDKGGRRSGIERRQISFSIQFTERRSGKDTRSGFERRVAPLYFIGDKERRKYI